MRRDPVTPELREAVFRRDGPCILAVLEPEHRCHGRSTIEHVHEGYGMAGKRAPSDMAHCVALCYGANVGVPSKAERAAIRAYLAAVESA